ncbi:MAG: AAA family ATPase [Vulcanimicrobiaceae bacterium]
MDMLSNPFSPGAGTPPPYLVGRDAFVIELSAQLERLLVSHRSGKGMLVTGLRGVGKTVLLSRFAGVAEDLGFATIGLEASSHTSIKPLLARDLRANLTRLHRRSGATEAFRRALGIFKSFSLSVGLDGSIGVSADVSPAFGEGDSGDAEADLRELFTVLGKAYREAKSGLLISIDEMQYLSREELGGVIGAYHRVVQLELPLAIIGAGLPDLPGLAGEAKTYAERLFRFPELGRLSRDEVAQAINEPAAKAQVHFSDGAIDAIARASDGYPYYVQEWAYETWLTATRSPITHADVDRASTAVVERLDTDFFRVRSGRVNASERHYLRAMAELGTGPHSSGRIADTFGASVQRVGSVRQSLIEKGMIYSPEVGLAAFSVPLFDDYMRRSFSLVQTRQEVDARARGLRRR